MIFVLTSLTSLSNFITLDRKRNFQKPGILPSFDTDTYTEETSVSSSSNPEVSTLPPETMEEFKELTEDDVKSLIQHSSSKSCFLDPIPSKLLPQCDVLLPVITSLINMSLRTGVVPRV